MVQFGVGSIGEIGFPTGMVMWVVGGPRSERDWRCDVTVFRAPMAAQFLPFFPDLVFAGLGLESNVAVVVKPGRSETSEHVGKNVLTGGIEKFWDGGYMEIQATIVDDDNVGWWKTAVVGHIFHYMSVAFAFRWDCEGVVQAYGWIDRSKKESKRFDPSAFEVRERSLCVS
jgi:hypothetical protein